MNNIRKNNNYYVLFPVAILAISTAAIFIRFAQETLPAMTIASYRLLLSSVFLFPFTYKQTRSELKTLKTEKIIQLILSGLLLSFHFTAWILSLEHTNILASVVLVTTTPIWVSILSLVFFKEKISKKFWLGLAIAFIGILIISGAGIFRISGGGLQNQFLRFPENKMVGNGLAILGAVCASGYVIIGRKLRGEISNRSYILTVYSISALFLVLFTVFIAGESMKIDFADFKYLVLLALIPQMIGHSLINRLLGVFPAHVVSIALLGEPIGSTLLAAIFLNEVPSLHEIIAAIVILAGIFISIVGKRKEDLVK